jgi:hypothetical protein
MDVLQINFVYDIDQTVFVFEKTRDGALDQYEVHVRTMASGSYSIAIKDSRGLSELSEARNSCYVAIWTDSPPLFFIATPDRCR